MTRFQRDAALTPADGALSPALLAALRQAPSPASAPAADAPVTKAEKAVEGLLEKAAAQDARRAASENPLRERKTHPYDGRYSVRLACGAPHGPVGAALTRNYTTTIRDGKGQVGRAGWNGTWLTIDVDKDGGLSVRGESSGGSIALSTGFLFSEPLKASGRRGPRRCRIELTPM